MELDEKEFEFNMQGQMVSKEVKPVAKPYDDYVEMPNLRQTQIREKKDKKNPMNDHSNNTEE